MRKPDPAWKGRLHGFFAVAFWLALAAMLTIALWFGGVQGAFHSLTGAGPRLQHVLGFLLLSGLAIAGYGLALRPIVGLVAIAVAIELAQIMIADREASLIDALASIAGVLLAVVAARLLRYRR